MCQQLTQGLSALSEDPFSAAPPPANSTSTPMKYQPQHVKPQHTLPHVQHHVQPQIHMTNKSMSNTKMEIYEIEVSNTFLCLILRVSYYIFNPFATRSRSQWLGCSRHTTRSCSEWLINLSRAILIMFSN